MNLLKCAKIMQIQNGAAAGTSLQTSSTFDMAGYNACLIICSVGAVTSGSVMQLNAQQGAASNGSDAATITGGSTAVLTDAGTNSNKIFLVDVIRPTKRYITATFSRTTQNAVVNGMWAILYQADSPPITLDTSVAASILESGN